MKKDICYKMQEGRRSYLSCIVIRLWMDLLREWGRYCRRKTWINLLVNAKSWYDPRTFYIRFPRICKLFGMSSSWIKNVKTPLATFLDWYVTILWVECSPSFYFSITTEKTYQYMLSRWFKDKSFDVHNCVMLYNIPKSF